jgi:hypothetical protein
MLRLILVALGFGFMANYVSASDLDKPSDPHHGNPWLNEHLLDDKALPPFSFAYDRQGSGVLLKAWPRETETKQLDGGRTAHIVRWTDPKTGLQVRLNALEFAASPVVEWTAYFKTPARSTRRYLSTCRRLTFPFRSKAKESPASATPKDAVSWTLIRYRRSL